MREHGQDQEPDLAEIQRRSRETSEKLRANLAQLKRNLAALKETAETGAEIGKAFERKIIPLLQQSCERVDDPEERRSA